MVFQAKNKKTGRPFPTWKLRITAPSGASAILSTERTKKADADKVEAAYKIWRGDDGERFARPDVLELLVDKEVTLAQAYAAHTAGTLNDLVADVVQRREAAAAAAELARQEELAQEAADAEDLRPHVALWVKWKGKQTRGAASIGAYLKQLEVLYPPGTPFTLPLFGRKELKARLEALDVDAPTRNRYKAAASSFGEYLLDKELIEINPARLIRGFGENPARKIHYAMADAKRLIAGLPQPNAALAAIMFGFAAEWGACTETIAGDLALDANPVTMDVRGTKTASLRRDTRRRIVPLVKELRWLLPYIRPVLQGKLPGAPLFPGLHETDALRTQRDVARVLKIHAVGEDTFGEHGLHDWRHSHAVNLLKLNYPPQIVADHLGHSDVGQVNTRYGLYITGRHDYARVEEANAAKKRAAAGAPGAATNPATTTPRRRTR